MIICQIQATNIEFLASISCTLIQEYYVHTWKEEKKVLLSFDNKNVDNLTSVNNLHSNYISLHCFVNCHMRNLDLTSDTSHKT